MTLAKDEVFKFFINFAHCRALWSRLALNKTEMDNRKIKKANFWIRRRSHIPMVAIATLMVLLLVFNEDTSISLNMEYERQINELSMEIKECLDSAAFFRMQREALEHGTANLEHIAREQYHMQRPTEDVFIIRESK